MKTDFVFSGERATYLQLVDFFRECIAKGELKPDDRLPAIRALAATLHIDPGTVARAYLELTKEGIIVARQGSGNYVAPVIEDTAVLKQRRQKLGAILEKAIIQSLGSGFSVEDLETATTIQLAEWRERRAPVKRKKPDHAGKDVKTIRFSGSHDLAIELLAKHHSTLQTTANMDTNFVGSLAGLLALERGDADIAGAHLADEETGEFNIPFIRKMMPNETVVVINLLQRVQGLIVAPGNPKNIHGVQDLMRRNIVFVNRQKGSGTRILLDTQLRQAKIPCDEVKGYDREETTHMAVAGLIARQKADVGMGAQSAADAFNLTFLPLFKERYDLIALQKTLDREPFSVITEIVKSADFIDMLNSIPGYDTADTGKIKIIET
ncbi:MAG: substrate-binding domain-containing protein [Dehalococcoidales bacterium]|nr:substrate-binding domain-containing protein [Dehalococcoidales bacterium]